MKDALFIIAALLGSGLGAAVFAWALLRSGAAYDKDMGMDAEERE
jgi:hypothetical protein